MEEAAEKDTYSEATLCNPLHQNIEYSFLNWNIKQKITRWLGSLNNSNTGLRMNGTFLSDFVHGDPFYMI